MSSAETTLVLVCCLVFASIALGIHTMAGTMSRRERERRRYGGLMREQVADSMREPWLAIDPTRLGINAAARRALRRDLVRAGFFAPSALVIFALVRIALAIGLPVIALVTTAVLLPTAGVTEFALIVALTVTIALYLPRAYLSRRQRRLEAAYRLTFPNFLDMLVVCVNAGLSLEAALDRAAQEIGEADREFRANFDLMASEMRAGKGTADALRTCADRLGLVEARSFAALLQQTLELGTDVAVSLTTFSDEMRDKRMARAEERAATLPPKLTLPLGLFIFPVVLIVVLAPAVMKVARVAGP